MVEAPWTITRLELLYYTRLHKRWQIWQEATESQSGQSTPAAFHRSQMFSLLGIVRSTLQEMAPRSGFDATRPMVGSRQFKITKNDALRAKLAEHPEFWKHYLNYISSYASAYGIPTNGDMAKFLQNSDLVALKEDVPITISEAGILDLISMLPVLQHWDLQGCWFHPITAGKSPFSGNIEEPFYMAHLQNASGEASQPESSDNDVLIATQPTVRVIYEDLVAFNTRSRIWNPRHFGPTGFFNCCHEPRDGDELRLYYCYAFLFDKLLKLLTDNTSFFIAYPIHVLGRLNFLHLWMKPKNPAATLEDLWRFWFDGPGVSSPLTDSRHAAFWFSIREFLRVHLRSIAHSTFQAAWQKAMSEPIPKTPSIAKPLAYSLCESAPLLMPLDWIEWDSSSNESEKTISKSIWRYLPLHCKDAVADWGDAKPPSLAVDSQFGALGTQWCKSDSRPTSSPHQIHGKVNTGDATIRYGIKLPKGSAQSHSIATGAVRLAIEQQLALGQMFEKQQHELYEKVNTWIMDQLKSYCPLPTTLTAFTSKRMAALDDWKAPDDLDPVVRDALQIRSPDMKLAQLAHSVQGIQIAEKLMSGNISFKMSLYLEIGPVAGLTHNDPTHWDHESKKLCDALNELECIIPQTTSETWNEQASRLFCKNHLATVCAQIGQPPPAVPNSSKLSEVADLHDQVRRELRSSSLGCPFPNSIKFRPIRRRVNNTDDPWYKFRPCSPVLDDCCSQLIDIYNEFGCNGIVCHGAYFREEISGLTKDGYSHTKPRWCTNIFAIKYSSQNGVAPTLGATASGNPTKRLLAKCKDYGTVMVGAHENGLTRLCELKEGGSSYGTIETMFGGSVEALECKANEAFVAIVVETVRLK